jgi:tetratricopeptide (TPR) repeat protein
MTQISPAKESHEKAWLLYLEERFSEAEKVLRENIERFPDYAQSHLLLGQIHCFSQERDFGAALKEFREVVRISPSSGEGHHWLGSAFEHVGQTDDAIASYREAIRFAPEDPRPHVALGKCFVRKGWYSGAIKILRRGLELKPYCTEADVRVFLAEALLKNGQIKAACAEWRRVIEIEGGYPSDGAPQEEAKRKLAEHCGNA